jgi:hypothetical protein
MPHAGDDAKMDFLAGVSSSRHQTFLVNSARPMQVIAFRYGLWTFREIIRKQGESKGEALDVVFGGIGFPGDDALCNGAGVSFESIPWRLKEH